jgi:imidazolonepropionase-like amidohydrolase
MAVYTYLASGILVGCAVQEDLMFLSAQRVFTGRTDRLLEDHVVEISDGQVVGIGPRRRDSVVPGLVDLGDVTVLPGLIDVHQHLAFDASTDPVAQLNADDDPTLLLRMRSAALRALAVGITTIRDLGDRSYLSLALRDWFAADGEVGPRIVASGPPITTRNGHCWFLGGEVDGPEGVRAGVRERVARGVDVIKVMASGGNMTPTVGPHESQFGLPELAVAIEEAHAAGLPLAVHAHGVQAVRDALAVGADSIEHCTFFTAEGVDAAPDVLAELAASTSVISMTAAVLPGDRVIYPAIAQRLNAILANHTTLYQRGARVVCSSDAGVGPNKPHDVLPYGAVNFLPMLGMTNTEAIANLTAVAAEVCGIADRTGTIEAGKDADLLVVAGNPLADLAALHDIRAVYARGRPVPVESRTS